MEKRKTAIIFIIISVMAVVGARFSMAATGASYLFNLSNFSGTVPYLWANMSLDPERNEIYVLDIRKKDVRIFNAQGMEIHRMGTDGSFGNVLDVTVEKGGNFLLLIRQRAGYVITRCNYRGEPVSDMKITHIPPELSEFLPERIIYKNGKLYLADMGGSKIVVVHESGEFENAYDLFPLIQSMVEAYEKDEKKDKKKGERADFGMGGFGVDGRGNFLFTTPMVFAAHVLSPDGALRSFGTPGSSRGKFGVVSGITADDGGFIYIADKLRCVVLIFDRDLQFVTEFGFRGDRPGNLIVPNGLVVDTEGRVYVSQAANRGVSVYRVDRD